MTVTLKFKTALMFFAALSAAPMALASDPTRPEAQLSAEIVTSQTAAVKVLPKLSMIRSQGAGYLALLDGQWRKAGDKSGVYQVRSISASQVTLMEGERSLVLNLFQPTTTTK